MSEQPDAAYELHDIVLTMDRHAAALLQPLGLTLRQHTALVIIDEHPGLRGRDLAVGLGVTPAGVTGIVRTLTREGLVHDVAEPGEGHRQRLELTTAGRERLRASTKALSTPFDDVVRRAGHDPANLARVLRDVTAEMRREPQGRRERR